MASCATYQAVVAAPEEFWTTCGSIIEALWSDLTSLLKVFI